MPILEGVEQAVTNSNFKYKAELGLDQLALQRDEAVAHWSSMNKIREGYISRSLRDFAQEDISEAMAQSQIRTGNRVAEDGTVAVLVAALSQILSKISGNTPPVTP